MFVLRRRIARITAQVLGSTEPSNPAGAPGGTRGRKPWGDGSAGLAPYPPGAPWRRGRSLSGPPYQCVARWHAGGSVDASPTVFGGCGAEAACHGCARWHKVCHCPGGSHEATNQAGPGYSAPLFCAAVLSSHGRKGSVESTETRRQQGPRGAHSGAHRGPCWGPFSVGRIIPLGFQGMGRKSAVGAQGAHWGPPGAH